MGARSGRTAGPAGAAWSGTGDGRPGSTRDRRGRAPPRSASGLSRAPGRSRAKPMLRAGPRHPFSACRGGLGDVYCNFIRAGHTSRMENEEEGRDPADSLMEDRPPPLHVVVEVARLAAVRSYGVVGLTDTPELDVIAE